MLSVFLSKWQLQVLQCKDRLDGALSKWPPFHNGSYEDLGRSYSDRTITSELHIKLRIGTFHIPATNVTHFASTLLGDI